MLRDFCTTVAATIDDDLRWYRHRQAGLAWQLPGALCGRPAWDSYGRRARVPRLDPWRNAASWWGASFLALRLWPRYITTQLHAPSGGEDNGLDSNVSSISTRVEDRLPRAAGARRNQRRRWTDFESSSASLIYNVSMADEPNRSPTHRWSSTWQSRRS